MSTRTAKDDSVFYQSRYASSPEFERGLIANLVAKRCEILDDKGERELIWFVQYLSHQPGGIAAVATELTARFADRLGTATMVKSGKENLSADEIKKNRLELPEPLRRRFPLRGETKEAIAKLCGKYHSVFSYSHLPLEARLECRADDNKLAAQHPSSYPASAMLDLCREAAINGFDDENDTDNLEKELCRLCLDPSWNLTAAAPWYFSELVKVLRDYKWQWIEERSSVVKTALGEKVCDALDFTLQSRSLTLLEGNPRLGKSFAARAWCEQHPGKARFVEVAPGNDEASFFRDLARGLGLGNFLNYKVVQIRERVESVLRTGDIILVLDEAQRLWPQRNLRECFPGRIVWVMTMANAGVPICMISTPQFIQAQKAAEKTGWNSAQLTGRIGHYEFLPTELAATDLIAVARAVLPEAGQGVLQALADYASTSSRYLAAVDSIAKRARYIAQINGRSDCSAADVRTAMKESVIPSDAMLVRTLEHAKKSPLNSRNLSPLPAAQTQIETPQRASRPVAPAFTRRGEGVTELVQG